MENFEIVVSISVQPDAVREQIEQAFIANFGPPGSDEQPGEHLARRAEEWILQIFKSVAINQAMQQINQQKTIEIDAAATIKKRKDKPVGKPKPGDVV